jgi:DNA-binding transcriptional MerR regulator
LDNLLPIGRFAQITRLSIKALRHYDELALLRPALVDPDSGYRYYSAGQAIDAERIRLLRELELPLDEIAAILREREPAGIEERLTRHRQRIEARIEEDRRRLQTLARLAACGEALLRSEVRVREVAAQAVAAIRGRSALAEIGERAGHAFGELMRYLGQLGQRPAGPPLSIYHGPPLEDDQMDIEWCVPCGRLLAGRGAVEGRELPAGAVACILHVGPYEEVGWCYGALADWMQRHGHAEAGPPREVYLVGHAQTHDPAEFRTEVQWPMEVS